MSDELTPTAKAVCAGIGQAIGRGLQVMAAAIRKTPDPDGALPPGLFLSPAPPWQMPEPVRSDSSAAYLATGGPAELPSRKEP